MKLIIKTLSILIIPTFLISCSMAPPVIPSSELTIEGIPVMDSVLIIEEAYSEGKDDHTLPAGIYLPFHIAHKTMSGKVRVAYSSPRQIAVGYFLLPGSTMCNGGIGVNITKPYDDHYMFASKCQGELSLIVNLERKVKFKIVPKASIQQRLLEK